MAFGRMNRLGAGCGWTVCSSMHGIRARVSPPRFCPGLIRRIRKAYACGTLYLSVYPENRTAIRLYERFGFRPNGERDIHGEHVMVLEFEGSEPDQWHPPGKEEAG